MSTINIRKETKVSKNFNSGEEIYRRKFLKYFVIILDLPIVIAMNLQSPKQN